MGESGLGMAHYFSGRPEGVQELEQALAHAVKTGKEYPAALLAQTLGEIYLGTDRTAEALTLLDRALDYYRRNHMTPHLERTLGLQATAFERQGEAEKAARARAEEMELSLEPTSSEMSKPAG